MPDTFKLHALVLESMVEGVSVSDETGIILYTNPAEDTMFGYERGELIGQHVSIQNTYPPEENLRIVQEVIECLKTNGAWVGEFSNRKKDGTAFTTLARITALVDGGKSYWVCVQEDITSRKEAQAAVANSQAQLTLITDALPVLISYVDNQERYRFNNKTYEEWFGHPRQEVTGRTLAEVLGSEAYTSIRSYVEQVLAGEQVSFQTKLTYKDAGTRYVEAVYVPDRERDEVRNRTETGTGTRGEVKGFVALVSDQTDRLRQEENERFLVRASEILGSSLDFEETLNNIAQLAVPYLADWFSIDLIMTEEKGSASTRTRTRARRVATTHVDAAKQVLAHNLLEQYPYTPADDDDDGEPPSPLIKKLIVGESFLVPNFTPEHLMTIARSPEHLLVLEELGIKSGLAVPLVIRGQTIGAFTLSLSESDRRYDDNDLRLAQELARRAATALDNARLYQALQQAVNDREEFLSVAAHELKTPLTGLKGFVQLLSRQLDKTGQIDPERLSRSLKAINEQTNKLSQLVSDLLDVTRIEGGRLSIEPHPTNLVKLVQDVLALVQASTNPAKHQLLLKAPAEGELWANVDPLRFEQVVLNLVDNAVKYSPNGGTVEVELASPLATSGQVRLAVTDQGIGIAPEQRKHIFDRFYRIQNGSLTGLGLGLYITRQIVELHGGRIEVESPPQPEPGGTKFVIYLGTKSA
jgi:PAS domain S-box-containing protein